MLDFADVRLYAFLPELCREFERLKIHQCQEPTVQEFEATITVRLHSDEPMNTSELARFLDRCAELFLPLGGPIDDSLIQAEVHWHELRKRGENENSPADDPAD